MKNGDGPSFDPAVPVNALRRSREMLELAATHGARVREDVADVAHAREVHDQALEAEAKPACLHVP